MGLMGAASAARGGIGVRAEEKLLDTTRLARYVDPLPLPAVLSPAGTRPHPEAPEKNIPYYRVAMRAFRAKVHRDLPPTMFWGYDGACPGPTLEAHSGEPILVEWVNELPNNHFLPIDHTLHGAEAEKPEVRTVVHLHGGRTAPESDGYPEKWFVPRQSATCFYPNEQEATALFYHDHAMGITRLNAVAGLSGLYVLRDRLEKSFNLPHGRYEVPLVLFDRSFHTDGQMAYPVSGKPDSPWVSEYYGSAILVNGRIFPYFQVEPRRYRFRLLNASNGSFYRLSFGAADSVIAPAVRFWQIASEQGFLESPAEMETLVLGPGDRADVIADFSPHAGKEVYLRTDSAVFMQLRVTGQRMEDESSMPEAFRPIPRMTESSAIKTRELTLADYQNRLGYSKVMLLNGSHWNMPVTENPVLNTTEIWSLINLTDDSHPIHLHLVRFQVLDRRPFDLAVYQLTRKIVYTGPSEALAAGELGWKDTVRADPMMVTRIIARFEGFTGRYVWHCHMLEHEDNEMMRPYEVVAR